MILEKSKFLSITALNTGGRCCELLSLEWKDIDFDKNEIKITKTLIINEENNYRLEIQNMPKTKKSNRVVPVPYNTMKPEFDENTNN